MAGESTVGTLCTEEGMWKCLHLCPPLPNASLDIWSAWFGRSRYENIASLRFSERPLLLGEKQSHIWLLVSEEEKLQELEETSKGSAQNAQHACKSGRYQPAVCCHQWNPASSPLCTGCLDALDYELPFINYVGLGSGFWDRVWSSSWAALGPTM